jgi:hypothetical protein
VSTWPHYISRSPIRASSHHHPRSTHMKSFTAFLAKGEALAKQVAEQAASVAEKAKSEEWVSKVSNSVNEVRNNAMHSL